MPNWDLDTNLVVTNKQPAGIVRGYGGQELNSCLSLLIGRTMREGGFDPVECYKKNYVGEGDVYTWRDGRQWQAHSVNYVKAIEASAEKFGWKDKWKGWGVPTWTSEDGRYVRGVGCGIIGNADIGEDNTEAYVRVVPDLVGDKARVVLQTNITESGMGQRSNIVKMVAEIMNVPFDKVDITPGDTMINPTGFGLCGSRGTITYGHAVSSAAEDARHKLFELAKPYLEVAEDSMYLTDYGVATVARPGKFVTWKKLIPQDLTLTGYGQHLENFSTPNMFIVFLEVQVDRETGKVDVLNMLGGTDCGQIIDPSGLEMQAQGGIGSASLDTATFEEHIIDPGTGRNLTYDMIEYKWRPFNEFPEYETCFLESKFDTFQFKATGVGEIAGAAAASATMQAISNAIGVQVSQYPATPDVILRPWARFEEGAEKMKRFDYVRPGSCAEASKEMTEGAVYVAGGSDLLGALKQDILPKYPKKLVSLKNIPDMSGIRVEDGALKIGAMTKLGEVCESASCAKTCRPWPKPRTPWRRRWCGTSAPSAVTSARTCAAGSTATPTR